MICTPTKWGSRKSMQVLAPLCASCFLVADADAGIIDFGGRVPLASFEVEDLVDISQLGSWNGAPVTPDNQPSAYHRRLHASLDFFSDETDASQVFLRVSNVVSTQGAWWGGSAFINTLLTSIDLALAAGDGEVGITGVNFDYANPGQSLLGTEVGAVESTLGWQYGTGRLSTASSWTYAFAEFGGVTGGTIQEGGGVFLLGLDHYASSLDWSAASLTLGYGLGNQFLVAQNTGVPAPAAALIALAAPMFATHRRRRA